MASAAGFLGPVDEIEIIIITFFNRPSSTQGKHGQKKLCAVMEVAPDSSLG
ncbi:hypothetical protein PGTUg99_036314 [Puccinia graminis f. sp. tritici]|uniref:Uncharacterized protein n=1 Tax=Puccinia graminis f. sp. tritici TaxID=56615 RepID=A0A5B0NQE5_PUCGR|nr:hypothetical protein PGTUg99_036314 [Puccinia graminis f. sp. tritici]